MTDQHPQAGFTLIEILTVVVIVGLIFGGVTVFITQGGADRQIDKAVERFVVISAHISELAILSGESVGLFLEPPEWRENPLDEGWRYSWQKETDQGWKTLEEIAPVALDNTISLSVFIAEQPWEYENAPKIRLPVVAFYPSGEVTPFEIEFTHDDLPGESETIYVDAWGDVVWRERQQHEEELAEFLR